MRGCRAKKRLSKGVFFIFELFERFAQAKWSETKRKQNMNIWTMFSRHTIIFWFYHDFKSNFGALQNWVLKLLRVQSFCGNSHTSRLLFLCHDWHRFESYWSVAQLGTETFICSEQSAKMWLWAFLLLSHGCHVVNGITTKNPS